MLIPKTTILPESQRQLWPELAQLPQDFVLYGGTALALRLGHRASVDFDFFSSKPFTPAKLIEATPFLKSAERIQSKTNTLSVIADCGGPVRVSFFGGLSLGRVGEPDMTDDKTLLVASLLDLAATKAAVVQERAEKKDYLDLYHLLKSDIDLPSALGGARALYGDSFNPMITLKALGYFSDGDLPSLPNEIKETLAAKAAGVTTITEIPRRSDLIAPCS